MNTNLAVRTKNLLNHLMEKRLSMIVPCLLKRDYLWLLGKNGAENNRI